MFDFFRDIILEAQGIDSIAAAKERSERREAEKILKKKQRIIFSKGAKILVFIFGIFYLIVAGFSFLAMKESGSLNVYYLLRFAFLISCVIATMICLIVNKRKAEIAALILIIAFFIAQYFTMLLM